MSGDSIQFTAHVKEQTLVYFPGDGSAINLSDKTTEPPPLTPVEANVLIARLRTHADLLDRRL